MNEDHAKPLSSNFHTFQKMSLDFNQMSIDFTPVKDDVSTGQTIPVDAEPQPVFDGGSQPLDVKPDPALDEPQPTGAEVVKAEATETVEAPVSAGKSKWRSTSDFPADPTGLTREELENHYLAMRKSHVSLARSRGQRKRYSKQWKQQQADLFNALHAHQKKITLLGKEKKEAMQLAKEFQGELETLERRDQALSQLLNEFDSSGEKTGFWDILKVSQLLQRMRQLFLSNEPNQGQDHE